MKQRGLDRLGPARRRWALAGFLALSVLSSLGHGGNPVEFAGQVIKDTINPEPPGCADNTLALEALGDMQSGIAGAPLPNELMLVVSCLSRRDRNKIAPPDTTVQWDVSSGGGVVNGLTSTSLAAPSGVSIVNWQLGPTVGTQTLTARSNGLSKVISATGTVPEAGGTCTDNVASTGTNFSVFRQARGAETWPLAGSPYRVDQLQVQGPSSLSIEAGVLVCVGSVVVTDTARLLVRGTPAQPVRIEPKDPGDTGVALSFYAFLATATQPSELLHTRVRGLAFLSAADHGLRIEDSQFSRDGALRGQRPCGYVHLSTTRADALPMQLRRSSFDGFGGNNASCNVAGVTLDESVAPAGGPSVFAARVINSPGTGIFVPATTPGAKSWVFEDCEVARSGNEGLTVAANVAGITGCAFSGNASFGLFNSAPTRFSVLARGNWWGDAAGAAGPAGDRVSAGVDASQFLTAPPVLGY